jgi:hypothetical protein
MTNEQIQLLIEIAKGKTDFHNDDFSEAGVATFQRLINDLNELDSKGYIQIIQKHRKSRSADENLDLVLVRAKSNGREWLANKGLLP